MSSFEIFRSCKSFIYLSKITMGSSDQGISKKTDSKVDKLFYYLTFFAFEYHFISYFSSASSREWCSFELFMNMKIAELYSYFTQRSFANVICSSIGERQGLLYGSTDERGRWWWSYCCWSKITQWNSSKTYFTRGYLYQSIIWYEAMTFRLMAIIYVLNYCWWIYLSDTGALEHTWLGDKYSYICVLPN